jgi:hypothetical protein
MKCNYCGKEMTKPHEECVKQAMQEMDRLGIIHAIGVTDGKVMGSFQDSFMSELEKQESLVRSHTLVDDTVDEDILTLLGVFGAMHRYVNRVSPRKLVAFTGNVFNSLMSVKYGSPVPPSKKFDARAIEYFEEVKSLPTDEETFDFFSKHLGRQEKAPDKHGMIVEVADLDKELDAKLDHASQQLLDTIEEVALKMEEKFGASTTWRGWRMDELLLQQIRDLVLAHLQTYPAEFEKNQVAEENALKLEAAFQSFLESVRQVVSNVSQQSQVPSEVVLARVIHNAIANLATTYEKLKLSYAKKHRPP